MAYSSIFADEWRECLQEQYKSVVRNNDQITLKTLVPVLHDVGFSEAELRDLAFQATLRAEDLADDFVPDMEIMSGAGPGVTLEPTLPVEAEALVEEVQATDDIGVTLEDALTTAEEEPPLDAGLLVESGVATEAELDATQAEDADDDSEEPAEPEPKLPPGVQQLSLF